jgi:hypothetical protein
MEIQSKAGEYEDISKEGKKNFFNFDEWFSCRMVLVKNIRNKGNTFSLCVHIAINIIEHKYKHRRRICESQHEWEIKNASQGFQITVNVL